MEHKPHLDMLMAREQLMEDIDSIVESQCGKGSEELVALLCDAVCRHFPTPKPD
jgi:hypothetical protein